MPIQQKHNQRYKKGPKGTPGSPKEAQMPPKGAKRSPKEAQESPMRSKGSPKGPKWAPTGPQWTPKEGKKEPQNRSFLTTVWSEMLVFKVRKNTQVSKKIRILQHLEAPKRVPREPPVIPKDPLGSQMGSQRVLRGVPTWPNLNRGLKITRCVK